MLNFFMAGSELVRWSLEAVEANGSHLRLSMLHSRGSIVEYFTGPEAALRREQELETLLMAARGFEHSVPAGVCP